jgi:hypothetical protein
MVHAARRHGVDTIEQLADAVAVRVGHIGEHANAA